MEEVAVTFFRLSLILKFGSASQCIVTVSVRDLGGLNSLGSSVRNWVQSSKGNPSYISHFFLAI